MDLYARFAPVCQRHGLQFDVVDSNNDPTIIRCQIDKMRLFCGYAEVPAHIVDAIVKIYLKYQPSGMNVDEDSVKWVMKIDRVKFDITVSAQYGTHFDCKAACVSFRHAVDIQNINEFDRCFNIVMNGIVDIGLRTLRSFCNGEHFESPRFEQIIADFQKVREFVDVAAMYSKYDDPYFICAVDERYNMGDTINEAIRHLHELQPELLIGNINDL